MSTSREKSKRKAQVAEPVCEPSEQKGMSKGLRKALIIAGIVIVVAFVIFSTMLTGNFFATRSTAATIGSHKLSPAMVNYYYRTAYQEFSEYASYLGVDATQPLTGQYVDEESGQTWADYLIDTGLTTAASSYAVYDKAIADGYQLTEQDKADIDAAIETLEMYAPLSGFNNVNAYLTAVYGKGCNEKNYRDYLEVVAISQGYLSSFYNQEISESERTAEYEANKDLYNGVNYRMIHVDSSFFEEGTENVAEQAAALAESILAASDSEEAFVQACSELVPEAQKEQYADGAATLHTDEAGDSVDAVCKDWLFDEARAEGDCTVIANEEGAYALYFLSRDTHDYVLPNVRHILIQVQDTTDTEAMTAAKEKAEFILDTFEASSRTEEDFAQLARENSDDGSASNGGLYENIFPNQMVANFSDWCFDEARQPGDTAIVETEYGYHVMYFSGLGMKYRDAQAEQAIRTAAYNKASEEASVNDGFVPNSFGMRFVTK